VRAAGGADIARRIVEEAARLLGAPDLVEIKSAHIDGCLYHGDSGVLFAEKLVAAGARVAVPTTLNVGALDLLHPGRVRFPPETATMARRIMQAYEALGCLPSWTCAPYQAGHRPRLGEHVAWGESNAVAFVNSVLGARTNRLGDFLDIACAIAGMAPRCGLHLDENRRARIVVETSKISERLKRSEVFWPVLGTWLGSEVGTTVAAITGLPPDTSEDRLKALGAAAASSGSVALFHVVGVTPEATTLEAALRGQPAERVIELSPEMLREARDRLSTASGARLDAVAIGSPHLSVEQIEELARAVDGRRLRVPFYACTGRAALSEAERRGALAPLHEAGITMVADTCVVVAPILPPGGGVLMTNSGKFAHYAPGNTGFATIYGSLEDCVASAEAGQVVRGEALWA
jgi:predicted aconitase